MAAIVNLALLTGCIGKETGGLYPIDEKNNVQGLLDMSAAFGGKSKTAGQVIEGIEKGTIKALYVLASDPVVSFPNSTRVRNALSKLELLIVQDIFPSETAQLANVVFAGSAAAEKDGTFTTIDNRVQSLSKAVRVPGDARTDLEILAEVATRLSGTAHSAVAADILAEIQTAVPGYSAAAQALRSSCGGFVKSVSVKANPVPLAQAPMTGQASPELTLISGSILYHNGTTTTWSENNLSVSPAGYVEISAQDAARMGISDGSPVKVTSGLGSIAATAKLNDLLQSGIVFAPTHFRTMKVNSLIEEGNMTAVTVGKG